MKSDNQILIARERMAKAVGRLMLAWASFGMPLTMYTAHAQGLPDQATTTQQRDAAIQERRVDDATADTLINQRASKLLNGRYGDTGAPLRTPNLTDTNTPVRGPRIIEDTGAEERARRQAAKITNLSNTEVVKEAEKGGAIGRSVYQGADLVNKQVTTDRVEPGLNQSNSTRVNAQEILPGFNASEASKLETLGSNLYNSPGLIKDAAEQNRRNMRRDGCRRTDFVLRERQNISQAATGANNRVLKVEFFDLVKAPIAGTNPVEYQTITQATTYKGGTINMAVATMGASSSVYWDKVNDTYAIRYTYTPFSSPLGRNYFTYNHKLGYSTGAAVQTISNAVISFGTPKEGFKPTLSYSVPAGTKAVYLSADLYQTDVNYSEPVVGTPCASDPPAVCDVASIGGDSIRWCPGSPGSNIASLYDDVQYPSQDRYGKTLNDQVAANAARKDFSNDSAIRGAVIAGINAGSSNFAQELVGQCSRDSVSRLEVVNGGRYGVPNIQMCSESLVNPFPQGFAGIKRSFGLSSVGDHTFLSVKAFKKTKVPITDPGTGQQVKDSNGNPLYTYTKAPINLTGAIDTNFPIMGPQQCPGQGRCSTEKPDDPLGTSEGNYLEYVHYPMGGDPKGYAFDGVYAQAGASSNFTDFGSPSANWLPTGTATGDGTLHEVRLVAKAYYVTINDFAGGQKYMQYVADGFCQGGKLTCKVTSQTRTVGGVTFGPGLANHGIVELLKNWGTEASTVMPADFEDGNSADPSPTGPAIKMLDDPMCWEADAEAFTSCATVDNSEGTLRAFMRDGQQWVTDCNVATDDNNVPLESSSSCKRLDVQSCDSRFLGAFTGQCYNPDITYDCGVTKDVSIPVLVDDMGDACSGAMRCIGTQCHRPNLSGSQGAEFTKAFSAMEAVNAMVEDMVCLETGEKPTSTTQTCTPYIFGGKAMYCKIPVANQIGITPNCCKDARKGAAEAPSWMEYLAAMQALQKIEKRVGFLKALEGTDVYNQVSTFFGDIKGTATDAYVNASKFVTDQFVTPFRAGFDNLFGGAAKPVAIDAPSKVTEVTGLIDGFKQQLMAGLNEVLMKIGGQDLAGMVFQAGASGELELTQGFQDMVGVFSVYSIAKLIGHIIFACKKEEFEWGLNDKWRLCTYADSCCSKKALFVCVEKRQLYCCYKSIAVRVISTELITKNLTGTRSRGFRTANNGAKLTKCNINCGGFTAQELAMVDWSKVNLSEWTDSLIESGLLNPTDPRTNFGVSQGVIKDSMVTSRDPDKAGNYTTQVPAYKSAELLSDHTDEVMEGTQTLQDEGENCYTQDNRLMPFTYPGCKKLP
jgi:hypothetical protein